MQYKQTTLFGVLCVFLKVPVSEHIYSFKISCTFTSPRIMRTIVVFLLSLIVANAAASKDSVFSLPAGEEWLVALPTNWQPIPQEKHIETLRFLSEIFESNAKQLRTIKTFSGTYLVASEDEVSSSMAKPILSSKQTNDGQSPTMGSFPSKFTRKLDYQFDFVSDNTNNNVFRSVRNVKPSFFSAGQPVEVTGISSSSPRSVTSSSDFLYIDEQFKANRIKEFPDYEGEINRVAYRVPREQGPNNIGRWAVLTPFEFSEPRRWPISLGGYYIPVLEGKGGKENQHHVQKNNMLFQAEDEKGQKWFRYQVVIPKSSEGHRQECNIFWNQQSNFLPVCSIQIRDGQVYCSIQVQWKETDNFFVPSVAANVYFMPDGSLSVRQKMTMQEMQINKPIETMHSPYSALGLGDGDTLVDKIKQRVFIIQDGKPVLQGKFYEKHQTPQERRANQLRVVMLIVGIGLIIFALYLRIRRKKQEKKDENA